MLGWFAAVRPGLMSHDSLSAWSQATEGGWVDVHAPAYTAAMWLSWKVVHDPSLVALGQSLLLAAGIVAVARAVLRLGAPPPLVACAAAVVVMTPMVGSFSMSLWKDVPYTAVLLFVGARILDVAAVLLAPAPARGPAPLRSLFLWLGVATVLRQNAILFVLVVLAVLLVVLAGQRRTVLLVGAAIVGFVVVLKAGVYPTLGVARPPSHAALATFMHDIAAAARSDPEVFEPDDRRLMEAVAPFATWRDAFGRFSCTSANWEFLPAFEWGKVEGRTEEYSRLWLEVLMERPGRVVGNRLCAGSIAWRPDSVGAVYTVSRGIDPNRFGLETRPLLADLDDLAFDVMDLMDSPRVQWLLWRGATWTYVAYLAVAVAARRRRRPVVLLGALPLLALQLSVLPVSPAQDARYMFAGEVLALLLLPIAASSRRGRTAAVDQGAVRSNTAHATAVCRTR